MLRDFNGEDSWRTGCGSRISENVEAIASWWPTRKVESLPVVEPDGAKVGNMGNLLFLQRVMVRLYKLYGRIIKRYGLCWTLLRWLWSDLCKLKGALTGAHARSLRKHERFLVEATSTCSSFTVQQPHVFVLLRLWRWWRCSYLLTTPNQTNPKNLQR